MKITAINYVTRADLIELEIVVNELIKHGWQPLGSISSIVWTTNPNVQYPIKYIQAMIPENKLAPTN